MRKAFADTMLEVGLADPKLVVLVGDISHGIMQPFAKACPGRYFNVGICEPTIVGMSAGISRSGLRPVAHTITPFIIERCVEQIKLDFCYQQVGGTLISVGSAFDYSGLGCSHHCYHDLGIVKALPNTEVVYPAMPEEFNILFKNTYQNKKLTYFRLPGQTHGVKIEPERIRLGKGVVVREGNDATILVVGPQLKTVMEAVPLIKGKGLDPEILYYPTIKPFDEELVCRSAGKTGNVLVVEEHSQYGGINADVLRATCNMGNVKYAFINIPDSFSRGYGSYEDHCASLGFTPMNIAEKTANLIF
jgi:transketolase